MTDYPEMPTSEEEWRAHWAVYQLTVAQRNAAWREIDRMRAGADVLPAYVRVNVLRALSEWAGSGDHDRVAREATARIMESFSSAATSAPEPEVRGYVVLVHPRKAGVVGDGWEMGWSEIHPTREAAEADAAHARAGDDVWNPRPEAHVGVVTALPAEGES